MCLEVVMLVVVACGLMSPPNEYRLIAFVLVLVLVLDTFDTVRF